MKLDKRQIAGMDVRAKQLQSVIVVDKGIAQMKHHSVLKAQERTSWNSKLLQDGDQGTIEVHRT